MIVAWKLFSKLNLNMFATNHQASESLEFWSSLCQAEPGFHSHCFTNHFTNNYDTCRDYHRRRKYGISQTIQPSYLLCIPSLLRWDNFKTIIKPAENVLSSFIYCSALCILWSMRVSIYFFLFVVFSFLWQIIFIFSPEPFNAKH